LELQIQIMVLDLLWHVVRAWRCWAFAAEVATSITPQTTNANILRLPIGQVISTCMWYIMSMKNSIARIIK
jgi:hypothetical protein